MISKWKNKVKQHFRDVLEIKTNPHSIAIGFAIGTLIGVLPTPGVSIILGIIVTALFKKVSKISLFIALAIWNPLVLIPFDVLSYKIGGMLFGNAQVVWIELSLFEKAAYFTRRYLIGNFIVAVIISAISYIVVRLIVEKFQKGKIENKD